MDEQLAVPAPINDRANRVGGCRFEGTAWGNDGNAHGQRLWMDPPALRNGGDVQRVRRRW